MSTKYEKKPVEQWLNECDYQFIGYMPSDQALLFVNFIKEVNGGSEENETPLVHLVMMDRVFNRERRCAILCHRGIGKTTLFGEYLILFIAAFGHLPGFGKLNLLIYVTDSIENGVKNLRRNVEFRYQESDFLQKLIPNQKIGIGENGAGFVSVDQFEEQTAGGRKFTDIRLEFCNHKGHTTVVKGYGAKALSLDSKLYTTDGCITIGSCKVGDSIFGADGKLTTIIEKSEVFYKPMYRISLCDGRSIKVSEDHLNSVVIKENVNNYSRYGEYTLTTTELVALPLLHTRNRVLKEKDNYTSNESRIFIKNCEPLEYPELTLPIDPYTLGVILGDGRIRKDCGSVELTGHIDDFPTYLKEIPYTFGKFYIDKRNSNVRTQSIRGLGKLLKSLKLNVHGDYKFIPEMYLRGSISQRLALLAGLMDTDGCVSATGRTQFSSNSRKLLSGVAVLVRSLGGTVKLNIQSKSNHKTNRIEIWLNMSMFRLERKLQRQRFDRKADRVAIRSIYRIDDEPSQCIAVDNTEHQFVTTWFTRTHNTGVRGAKEMAQRPTLAILDDLVSDTDAESATVINTIENTVYKAVSKALHPTRQKIIWLGTPFNARDPLYKAVESGAWKVSVFPVCEKYPVDLAEFKGSWEDRFPYSYVKDEYDEAQAVGKPENFDQELMLRIMSDEDRIVQDSEIQWYKRANVLTFRSKFNFYITTDFATTVEEKNDYSIIFVWAVNNKGQYFLVDGICKKQLMDKNLDDLFRLAQKYNPQLVGLEVSGQQGGFIPWIQEQMMTRNIFFNFASENNANKPGIKPTTNKIQRFMIILPWFKAGNIFFPEELKDTPMMLEYMGELKLASKGGFKSKHDDCMDGTSQLGSMQIWRPSEEVKLHQNEEGIWAMDEDEEDIISVLDHSYIV
jgi:predicted phage terminase large subunit-like protein